MKMRLWFLLVTMAFAPPVVAQTASEATWPRLQTQVFVDLVYPPEAIEARLVGEVIVQVTTDGAGRVMAAEALTGAVPLATAAVDNAKRWTLSPGVGTGVLVYRFEISDGLCNDDSRSLFRLTKPNFAVITACTASHRTTYPSEGLPAFVSYGDRPRYPPIAQSARITGVVVLEVRVDRRGRVVESTPLTKLFLLTDAAVAHTRRWRTHPGETPRRILVVYEFALDNEMCENQRQTMFLVGAGNHMKLSGCAPPFDF